MQIDDLSSRVYAPELHTGAAVRAVGWLGKTVPRRGRLHSEVLEQLRHYRDATFQDDGDLGYHECEICGVEEGHGEFWIEWDGVRYVLPAMVLHYCEAHEYLPPEEFLGALARRWTADHPTDAG
jgi:hypothetical protein